jgi:hypothetical protein
MDVLLYLITFAILLFVLNVRIFRLNTSFFNISLNAVLLVSVYATIVTNANSIFLVSLLLLIAVHFRAIQPGYDWQGLKDSLAFMIVPWLFFVVFTHDSTMGQKVPYMDYVFYGRVAHWLHISGVETTNTVSHALGYTNVNPTFYHYFELWLSNALYRLNGGTALLNLFLVSYPLALVLTSHAIKELVNEYIPKVAFPSWLLNLMITILSVSLLFFQGIFQWTELFKELSFIKVSSASILSSIKLIYVLPVVFSIIFLSKEKESGWHYPVIFSFFYLTVFFPMVGMCTLLLLFQWVKSKRFNVQIILPPIALLMVLGFYVMNAESRIVASDNPSFFAALTRVSKFAAWFLKAYPFFIISWAAPLAFLLVNRKQHAHLLITLVALFVPTSVLWLLMYLRLDAQQLFDNIMIPMMVAVTCYVMVILASQQKWKWLVVFFLIHTLQPIAISSLPAKIPTSPVLDLLEKVSGEDGVVMLYHPDRLQTIYSYNEKFYTYHSELFVKFDGIQLINLNAAYPIKDTFDEDQLKIIRSYKRASVYLQSCPDFDFKDFACLVKFMGEHDFSYVLSEFEIAHEKLVLQEKKGGFYLYKRA